MNPDHPAPTALPTFAAIAARANAAAVDVGLVGILCATLTWTVLLSNAPRPTSDRITVSLLAAVMLLELLTGLTLGKFLFRLPIRRFQNPSRSPPLWSLLIRGLVRLLPVFVFFPSLVITDDAIRLLICAISPAIVLCYLTTCYLTLMRRGRTLFDLAAGTIVIHRN